uniref:Mur ligase domain-containing protein n=1 Tax=Aggregatilinea sp. TaxID=2806333 RepID=UPI002BEB4539
MKFSELAAAAPNLIVGPDRDAEITAPVTESAQAVQPGGVFLARPGASVDGHDLIAQAVERGAAAVIGERAPDQVACPVPYAQV